MLISIPYIQLAWPTTWGGASFETEAANNVNLIKVYIPATIAVSYVVVGVYVEIQNEVFGVGLYTLAGNLVFQSGAITITGNSIHGLYSKSFTPVTVGSGMYYLAISSGPGLATYEPMATPPLVTNLINEGGRLIIGDATNAGSNGVLPSTTGTINNKAVPGSSLFTMIKFGA